MVPKEMWMMKTALRHKRVGGLTQRATIRIF